MGYAGQKERLIRRHSIATCLIYQCRLQRPQRSAALPARRDEAINLQHLQRSLSRLTFGHGRQRRKEALCRLAVQSVVDNRDGRKSEEFRFPHNPRLCNKLGFCALHGVINVVIHATRMRQPTRDRAHGIAVAIGKETAGKERLRALVEPQSSVTATRWPEFASGSE